MSSTQALDTLLVAYGKTENDGMLNTAMRKALRLYAAAQKLQFQQDNLGNIYVSRYGRDDELANIAIAFPLDSSESSSAFTSAFKVFTQLANEDLVCGVTLMGCTSVEGKTVGLQLWDTYTQDLGDKTHSNPFPQLQQFSNLLNPAELSFSAIFEVSETMDDALKMHGSPVLIEHAKNHIEDCNGIKKSYRSCLRAPYLLMNGRSAENITKRTVCDYSEYIAALFDNFD